jgi:hypothetical protein
MVDFFSNSFSTVYFAGHLFKFSPVYGILLHLVVLKFATGKGQDVLPKVKIGRTLIRDKLN